MENQARATESTRFDRVLTKISQIMAAVGAGMFGIMVVISVIDIGGRYFFKHPLKGAAELVGLMLVIGGTWGMAYCQVHKMHIRIDILSNKFPQRVQSALWVVAFFICATVAALITWQAFVKMNEYILTETGARTDILGIPLWPFAAMMAVGFAWLCFVFLTGLVQSFIKALKT